MDYLIGVGLLILGLLVIVYGDKSITKKEYAITQFLLRRGGPISLQKWFLGIMLIGFSFIILFGGGSSNFVACDNDNENAALVILAMQNGFMGRTGDTREPENRAKIKAVLTEQVDAIRRAKEANIPIIVVEYGDKSGRSRGPTNTALTRAIGDYKDVKFVVTSEDDMFSRKSQSREEFVEFLANSEVDTLIMMGANGGASVRQSINGTLRNRCSVVAYTHAIIDFNHKQYIYPYEGRYSGIIRPTIYCRGCFFKEVSTLDAASKYMVNKM